MMGDIEIRCVEKAREREEFLSFPWQIYRGDPLWVPPLLPERRRALDPARGAFFQRGEAQCFMAYRGRQPVGTICAAHDRVTNQQRGLRDCLFGFFEYVQDEAVFHALVGAARQWAAARGLTSLMGPFNLDYEDAYGVLIEGRDRPPALLCGHSPPYYAAFMQHGGFRPARGDNLAYALDLTHEPAALRRLPEWAERVRKSGRFVVRGADFKRWDAEVEAVWGLINPALAHLPDFIPWQREALVEMLAAFRQIADPELILFAEDGGRVVGFFPGLPNLNEALIHANGLRYPWNYLKLAWHMRRRAGCLAIKSVLVLPEYWGSGAAILLFDEMLRRVRARGYRWVDLSLTSDDNPRTPVLAERLGAQVYKRYRVYRLEV